MALLKNYAGISCLGAAHFQNCLWRDILDIDHDFGFILVFGINSYIKFFSKNVNIKFTIVINSN